MFKKVSPYDLNENVFKLLNKDWMLLTSGDLEDANTMTASWGHLGIMWNLPTAICYVRPQRHTFTYINDSAYFTLCFFEEEYRKVLQFCGSKSGRDYDKFKECDLTPLKSENGSVYFEEARLMLECKKIYHDEMKKSNFVSDDIASTFYKKNDFHHVYYGEVTSVLIKE